MRVKDNYLCKCYKGGGAMFSKRMGIYLETEDVTSEYNRKLMLLFCSLVLAIDLVAFVITHLSNIAATEVQRTQFTSISAIYFLFLLSALGIYKWRTTQHSPMLSRILFTLILSYRLVVLLVLSNAYLVLIVYMGLFGIISTAFYLKYELIYVALVTQSILGFYLRINRIDSFEAIGIMFFSTAIILSLIHISNRSRVNFIELNRQKAANINTSLMLESLINQLDEMVVIVDEETNFVLFNESFMTHTGFFNEPDTEEFIHAVGMEQFINLQEAISRTIESQQKQTFNRLEFLSQNQLVYYFSLTFHPFNFSGQRNVLVVATDLTKERNLSLVKDLVIEMNHMLNSTHSLNEYFEYVLERLMATIQHADLGSVLILGQDNNLSISASRGYADAFRRSFRLPIGDTFYCRINPKLEKKPVIINDIDQLDMHGFTNLLANQRQLPVYSSISCPIFLNDQLHGLINLDSSKNNVYTGTDLEVMTFLMDQVSFVVSAYYHQEQTRYLSTYDQLTGLYNRWYLDQITNEVIPFCTRHQQGFVLMVIDLNHLKRVNDEKGHAIGDAYIVEACRLFKGRFRHSDLMIRIGGDEFVIVLYNTPIEDCDKTLQEISNQLEDKMLEYDVERGICALAYGGAQFPDEGNELHLLLKIADERMYQHKHLVKAGS